jgi:hypothetical protein
MMNLRRWIGPLLDVGMLQSLVFRLRAAGLHFLLSGVIVAAAGTVVFLGWYPLPFNAIAGVASIFWLLICVDLMLGPLLTLAVYAPHKPARVRGRDVAVIATFQVVAFAYGLSVMHAARPVYLVHEVDRLHVLTASDITPAETEPSQGVAPDVPTFGVRLVGVRDPRDGAEKLDAIEQALAGRDTFARPDWWTSVNEEYRSKHGKKVLDVLAVAAQYPALRQPLNDCLKKSRINADEMAMLPLLFNGQEWWVILDRVSWSPMRCLPIAIP